jgi:microcystin-dependent protein|tara:strand:+ start:317 stop:988 length:672 start_codon:yes stop_codon:yes gene_type:complete
MALYSGGTEMINGGSLLVGGIPTGTVVPWTKSSVATGFLECNGAAVSRSTYSALFAVIGTTYGAGNGSSTFNVPDLQDKDVMGKSGNKALASTGGANTVAVASSGNISSSTNTNINVTGNVAGSTANAALSTAQLASHSHSFQDLTNQGQGGGARYVINRQYGPSSNYGTQNTGSGGSHSHNMSANFSGSGNASSSTSSNFSGGTANPSVLQPYLALIYIIKT